MNRAKILLGGVAAVAVLLVPASPAAAASSGGTVVTATVTAGTLDIAVPGTANIGSGGPGTAITGSLGTVTVTDGRASATATWTATVVSTNFTVSALTIPAASLSYWSGPSTATTGNGTFTPGQTTAGAAAALSVATPLTAFSHVGGTGNNTQSWAPTLIMNVPLSAQAGVYTGTVTHSVA